MNDWQISRQIKAVLKARTWEGSGQVVFGSVHVTNGYREEAAKSFRFPLALVGVGNGTNDDQVPGLEVKRFSIVIATHVLGDALGENSVLGANRQGTDRSQGRGILEVKEEVMAACQEMQENLGIRILFRATNSDVPAADEGAGMTTWMGLDFEATCTTARYYHAPNDLVITPAAGQATLQWANPPSRYDLRRVRVRRIAGSSPPSSISAGSEVALATDLPTSKVDVVAAGTYTYGIFACYDETNSPPSADQRFSAVEVGSYRTVIVT